VLVFIRIATVGIIGFTSQWHQEGNPTAAHENAGRSLPVLEAPAKGARDLRASRRHTG